jgi:hypothetical protein
MSDYNKHKMTAKHKMVTIDTIVSPQKFSCGCGRIYKYQSGLFRHKRKCKDDDVVENIVIENDEAIDYKEMFLTYMKENDKKFMTLLTENSKLVSTISDMVPKIGNNNNNNNNRFNINVFLNEDCKDAITMDTFMKGVTISLDNLLITKDKGLGEGITSIFIDNMRKLSVHERPIHCSDLKRDTLYIKNEEWEKDVDNKQIGKVIGTMCYKQVQSVGKWTDEYPDYEKSSSKTDEYVNLIRNCTQSPDENEQKILRNISKEILMPKTH